MLQGTFGVTSTQFNSPLGSPNRHSVSPIDDGKRRLSQEQPRKRGEKGELRQKEKERRSWRRRKAMSSPCVKRKFNGRELYGKNIK